MQVKIIETGEIVAIRVIDANGTNWIDDLIGNHDAIGPAADGKFEWSEESGCHQTNAATVAWWQRVTANFERAEALRAELRERGLLDEEAIADIQAEAGNLDLEDQAPAEIEAMQDILDASMEA